MLKLLADDPDVKDKYVAAFQKQRYLKEACLSEIHVFQQWWFEMALWKIHVFSKLLVVSKLFPLHLLAGWPFFCPGSLGEAFPQRVMLHHQGC